MPTYYANVMGAEDLAKALSRVPNNTEQVLSKALYEEGQMAFAESQKLTPIDTGALRGSGVLHTPNIEKNKISVALTYGGCCTLRIICSRNFDQLPRCTNTSKILRTTSCSPK